MNGLTLRAGVKSHSYADRRADLYETPAEATRALLKVESFPHLIWEPACGRGAITRVLRAAGHGVLASDLNAYGAGQDFQFDFLERYRTEVPAIITNPPYRVAAQFVRRATEQAPKVAMLMRLAFLESEARRDVLEQAGLARVHVFRNRLPMMHRDGWAGPRASSAIAFAWFVWERGHQGPPMLNRISWEPIE